MVLTDGTTEPELPVSVAPGERHVVTLGSVRVRTGPGTQYPKLFTAAKGTRLPYIETDAGTGWYAVETGDGEFGYITGKARYTRLV